MYISLNRYELTMRVKWEQKNRTGATIAAAFTTKSIPAQAASVIIHSSKISYHTVNVVIDKILSWVDTTIIRLL